MKRKRHYKKRYKKEEGGFHMLITIGFILEKKNTKRNWSSFTSCKTFSKRRQRHYWTLMVKKKIRLVYQEMKSKTKNKKQNKTKRTKGFGDGFKL